MSNIPPHQHGPGVTGRVRSFLDDCWAEAAPGLPGQQGGSGGNNPESDRPSVVADPATPDLPQPDRGNKSAAYPRANAELPRYPEEWGEEGRCVYDERIGVAIDQGMDVSPGSEAEQIARREARRVQAGLPGDWPRARDPDIFDAALEAFAPVGGLAYLHSEPRKLDDEDAANQQIED